MVSGGQQLPQLLYETWRQGTWRELASFDAAGLLIEVKKADGAIRDQFDFMLNVVGFPFDENAAATGWADV